MNRIAKEALIRKHATEIYQVTMKPYLEMKQLNVDDAEAKEVAKEAYKKAGEMLADELKIK